MKNCINGNICDIVRLCKEYVKSDYATPYMREMTNIPLDLLVKGVTLSLPDPIIGEWNDTLNEVEEILEEDHILFVTEDKKLVRIAAYDMETYDGAGGQYPKINFYSWCIFIYTYVLTNQDRETRLKFLWQTILFPYIYKLNIYSPTTFNEEIRRILREYSIVEGEDSENETLKILQQHDPKKEFERIVDNINGISALLPSQGARDTALRISRSGWENLVKGYKKSEEL